MKVQSFFHKHAGFGNFLATLTNAGSVFFVFRFGYQHLGPPVMGMWALIQAIMLISRLSDMGSAGNITRLVAIEYTEHKEIKLPNFVLSGLLVSTLPIFFLGTIIFMPTYYYVESNYAQGFTNSTLCSFIASSLAFGVFTSVSSIFAGCLDGLGFMALRGYLSCVVNILFVFVAYFLIHAMGEVGLAITYVVYSVGLTAVLGLGILFLRVNQTADYEAPPIKTLITKSISFNAGFFAIGVCRLLFDPICKVLIGAYSTLDYVAIFDLANKISSQVRILFSSALYAALPLVSQESQNIAPELRTKLLVWHGSAVRWAFYTMSVVSLMSGVFSIFSLGHIDKSFILQLLILCLANAINVVGLIGYYMYVGSGRINGLLTIHIIMTAINLTTSVGLGYLMGATGVAIGLSIALSYAGIACARPLLGDTMSVLRWHLRILPQMGLLFTSFVVTWFGVNFMDTFPSIVQMLPNVAMLLFVVAAAGFDELKRRR